MMGTDMNIVEFGTSGSYTLVDSYSSAEVAPLPDINVGGKNDLVNAAYSRSSSGLPILIYQRKLNTGDAKDKILALGSNNVSIAWGDKTLADHGANRKETTFTLATGT